MKYLIASCLCAIAIASMASSTAAERKDGVVAEHRVSELETPVVDLVGKSSLYVVEKMPWLGVQFRASTNRERDRWSPDVEIRLVYIGEAEAFSLSDPLELRAGNRTVAVDDGSLETSLYEGTTQRRVRVLRQPWTTLEWIAASEIVTGRLGNLTFEFPRDSLANLAALVASLKVKIRAGEGSWWQR